MRDLLRRSMVLSLLVLMASFSAGKFSSSSRTSARVIQATLPRTPAGVYAHADIELLKKQFAGAQDLRKTLRKFYRELLSNPAISGLTIGAHWDHLQPGPNFPDGYDFNFLDDVFEVANRKNKSVQLIITPGFVSPKWLLKKLPSCDGLFPVGPFQNEAVDPQCGKATFEGFPEEQRGEGNTQLPLPWNPVYQEAWKEFLGHLNDRYGSNPAFFAIAVAGPVAGSDEMILPTSNNTPVQTSGFQVDDMWETLIQHSFPAGGTITYPPKSDQVFIDAWVNAIHTYEGIFSGITLVLSPDRGNDLPEFRVKQSEVQVHPDNGLYLTDCATTTTPLSCEAKTEVIQYFMNATCFTSENCVNGKSTQVGGLTATISDVPGSIGIAGVKLLTSWSPPLLPAFLGGAEFDYPVSGHQKLLTGCPSYPDTSQCHGLSVEEAAYNVLAVFFNRTPAGSYFIGTMPAISATGNPGSIPMHYLEVPELDVVYANTHQCLSDPSPVLGYMTLQQMLENVKRDFAGIADGTLPTEDTTPPVTTPILPSPTGLNGWYLGPTVLNFKALDDLSGVIKTKVSLDNRTTWEPLPCDGIALNDDGVYKVFFHSIDLATNKETPKSVTVKIDSIAPVTTVNYQQLISDHLISFAATDNLSGVARTEYKLDGSSWIEGTTLIFTSGGLHTILFRSIDVAGNVEKTNSITLNVRLKPPPIQPR